MEQGGLSNFNQSSKLEKIFFFSNISHFAQCCLMMQVFSIQNSRSGGPPILRLANHFCCRCMIAPFLASKHVTLDPAHNAFCLPIILFTTNIEGTDTHPQGTVFKVLPPSFNDTAKTFS